MDEQIKDSVKRQFGTHAAEYVTSSVHAKGSDLPLLPGLAELTGAEEVLDVATAAGHTALALSRYARHVVGMDLTEEMLQQARLFAAAQGVTNVEYQVGDAEHLPFADQQFDVISCRIAAHHFPNVMKFCQEAARVLKPGGRLIVIDNYAPEDDELDRFINTHEKLRDPSHFRCHRLSEWEGYVTTAGLRFHVAHRFSTPMEMEDWLRRMSVPEAVAAEIRQRCAEAPAKVREAFELTPTHFTLHKAILLGRK